MTFGVGAIDSLNKIIKTTSNMSTSVSAGCLELSFWS